MSKRIVIWDIICYLIFPIVIWNYGKNHIGEYYAMLVSTLPGILYSIVRFILLKRVNLFGIFMVLNLLIGTLVDVLAGSAIQMLWNDVFYSYILALIFIVTIVVNKPLFLFFSLDLVEMQGHNRTKMKSLFYQKKILFIYKLITFGFAFREILLSSLKIALILKYGVNSFDKSIILRQILSWGTFGISFYGFFYISKLLNNQTNSQETSDIC
ncbi:VC0807 family protein [Heyndrickxia sp. FSL W8-0423]|uniref:VC0807 family protein n=1 Tax=Heyndrickxia sp. FSL W8-0423 TaxID=2921601 RepID=UPI0030F83D83